MKCTSTGRQVNMFTQQGTVENTTTSCLPKCTGGDRFMQNMVYLIYTLFFQVEIKSLKKNKASYGSKE